jgi:hypothetical protein
VWAPSDVYGVRLPLPGDSKPLVLGQVTKRKGPQIKDDPFFGLRPDDEAVEGDKRNNPMMPIALSVLDGWWAEAYDGQNGFAIGIGETHSSPDVHDARDAAALLQVLRDQVVPLYYERDRDGLPRAWITRMKRAIRTLGGRFSADRMMMDYVQKCYIPAAGGTSSEIAPSF